MGRRILALVGNPNVGKTMLFNSLCNTNERVGNWHGVTTEKKVYSITHKSETIDIVDLPGCYNLSGYSLEEKETAKFLSNENCCVVNICESRSLERNLYLTLLLLEQNQKVLLFINSYAKNSPQIDYALLNRLLGVEILAKTAERVKIDELMAKNFCQNKPNYYDSKFESLTDEEKIKIRYGYIETLLSKCIIQKQKSTIDLDKVFIGKFDLIVFCIICFGLFYICFGSVGKYLTNFLQTFLQNKVVLPVNNILTARCSELLTSFVCDGLLSACLGLVCFRYKSNGLVFIFFFLFFFLSF